ncbi:MAG: alkaline phosphatase family protein [Thaumarchaeota archaeon]|nr:alkaline phosphatase family protein [Nitrososphaerota archaeon]
MHARPNNVGKDAVKEGKIPSKFLKPRYDGYSISNVPDTVASLLGSASKRSIKDERLSEFRAADNVVLLLLDGFGSKLVEHARNNFGIPSFDLLFAKALQLPITSVFPSTTSSAMSSLHTGLTPQEHGVIGYTMFLREIGTIAQMLRFVPILGGRSMFDLGFDARDFLSGPTIHERLNSDGLSSTVYVPRYIVDSGLSRITYRGAIIEPDNSVADMLVRTRRNLEQGRANSFHFLYHPSPDTIAHARGPHSEEFAVELDSIFALVRQELFQKLDKNIAKRTVLLVTGDHGAVNVKNDEIMDIAAYQEFSSLLRLPPTGDSRATILHVKDDNQKKVAQFFDTNFSGLFEVRESQEMLNQGYFGIGEIMPETKHRIGDLIVLPRFHNAIDNSRIDPRHSEVPGRHGGLSEEEMQVPLIVTKLSPNP